MSKVVLTLVLFFLEREWKLIFHAALVIFFPSLEPPSDQEKVGRRLGQAGYPLQQVKSWKPFCRHPSRIALDPPAHLAI